MRLPLSLAAVLLAAAPVCAQVKLAPDGPSYPTPAGMVQKVNGNTPDIYGNLAVPGTATGDNVPTLDSSFSYYATALQHGQYYWDRAWDDTVDNATHYGRLIQTDDYGDHINFGSFPSGFVTHTSTALGIIAAQSTSGIGQGINISFAHYGYTGDSSPFYGDDNYIPGTASGGSDEGHAGLRMNSIPIHTFNALLSSDPVNIGSTNRLRFNPGTTSNCGGNGSSFLPSSGCAGSGGLVMDYSRIPTTSNGTPYLHMTAYTGSNAVHGTLITVAETVTPGIRLTSTASLGVSADVTVGDNVTIPVTLPTGFTGPLNGNATVSGGVGSTAEEMLYTISGVGTSNPTMLLTGHRFPHSPATGGTLTICLNSMQAAVWLQDATDNGTGPTAYQVIGFGGPNGDPHTVEITTYANENRFNGTIDRNQSIRPDGGTLGAFAVVPAALAVGITDPSYKPDPVHYPYSYPATGAAPLLTVKLGTNTVPWAAGDNVMFAYGAADTYAGYRAGYFDPLGNSGGIQAGQHLELRGSLQQMFDTVFDNVNDVATRRGYPWMFTKRSDNSLSLGAWSGLIDADVAPRVAIARFEQHCDLASGVTCPTYSIHEEKGSTFTYTPPRDGTNQPDPALPAATDTQGRGRYRINTGAVDPAYVALDVSNQAIAMQAFYLVDQATGAKHQITLTNGQLVVH